MFRRSLCSLRSLHSLTTVFRVASLIYGGKPPYYPPVKPEGERGSRAHRGAHTHARSDRGNTPKRETPLFRTEAHRHGILFAQWYSLSSANFYALRTALKCAKGFAPRQGHRKHPSGHGKASRSQTSPTNAPQAHESTEVGNRTSRGEKRPHKPRNKARGATTGRGRTTAKHDRGSEPPKGGQTIHQHRATSAPRQPRGEVWQSHTSRGASR